MKVIHITSEIGWRGGERQLLYLLELLQNQNVENILICVENAQIENKLSRHSGNSVTVFHLNTNKPYNPFNWKKLRNIVKNAGASIIHIHTPAAHTLVFLSKLALSIPVVLHRRTIFPIKKNWFTRKKYLVNQIKCIICTSDAIKKYVDAQLGDKKKTVTIHDGIDLAQPEVDKKSARKNLVSLLKVDPEVRIIGNIAALTSEKGYQTFMAIAEKLIIQDKNIHIVIAGKGELEDEIKNQIEGKSLQSNIHMIGFQENIGNILPGFDILLMPSKMEGLGTAIMDAFLAQTTVISTNTGGIPELVIHNKTGLLFEVDDVEAMYNGIHSILNDSVHALSLTKNAAIHLLHFSKENMARKTLKLYYDLLQ